MSNQLCFRCFKVKGDYTVCPHCGYEESTKAEQACQLAPGTILRGRYIIGTSIGYGGFGITYKAYDTVLSVVVAVKEFYPAGLVNRGEGERKVGIFSGEKEEEFKRQLARFLEEARNMAIFSKEKDIINVYDYFEENQTAYIIMEYVDAPLLKTRLKERGKFPVEEAVAYMLALLDALSKIHYHGIIHKDISPDNIFLTGEKSIKLFDFGAAKFQGTETERTESIVVKAGYTPPEQYRSKNDQGPFMDIYAAGAVFYEMVTGEKPAEAPDRDVCDELKKPGEYGIEIEEQLERVILKALALNAKQRFQTAEQMKEAILSKKKVELPEEEIKRLLFRKRLAGGIIGGIFAITGGILLLSQTVFSSRGKIDVAGIREDSIEIWIPASDEETGSRISDALKESMEKECPQVEVSVKTIAEEKYEDILLSAAECGELPEVFCTDSLDARDYCISLSGLLHTMKLSSYLYLEEMDESVCALPTAVQVGVVYVNEEKEKDSQETFSIEKLYDMEDMFRYADEETAFSDFQDMDEEISWIVGDLSDMEEVRAVTIDQIPPTDFTVSPILTEEGELTAVLKNCYGVNKDATENQKQAGMFLLSLLLSDGVQSAAYMDNEEGIPLNKTVFGNYRDNKMTTYLAFLKEYDIEDAALFEEDEICQVIKN